MNDLHTVQELEELAQITREASLHYGNCAQASFDVLQKKYNLEQAAVVKALAPLPGIAGRGETCGAVIGCILALGFCFETDQVEASQNLSFLAAREFCRLFENKYGSTSCGKLLTAKLGRGFDFANPADMAEWASSGEPEVCTDFIVSAVQFAADLIMEEGIRKEALE